MTKSLRANPTWKATNAVAGRLYAAAEEIQSNYPDEKWTTVNKLRTSASDAIFYIAQAIASTSLEFAEYEWNGARKNLFSLQTTYIFVSKQKMIELNPELVVQIDEIIKEIDAQIVICKQAAIDHEKADLEPWLKKHKLWQDMHGE